MLHYVDSGKGRIHPVCCLHRSAHASSCGMSCSQTCRQSCSGCSTSTCSRAWMRGRQPGKGRVAAAAVTLQLREAAFAAAGVAGALGAVEAAIGDCQTAPFLSNGKESCWLPKGVYHPLLCHAHKAMCAAFSVTCCVQVGCCASGTDQEQPQGGAGAA